MCREGEMLKPEFIEPFIEPRTRMERQASLTTRHILSGLALAAVLAILGILSVYVRFLLSDLQLERQRLQARERELRVRLLRLEQQVVDVTAPEDMLKRAAHEFQMREPSAANVAHAVVPRSLEEKYLHSSKDVATGNRGTVQFALPTEDTQPPTLVRTVVGIIEASRAYARPTRD
ncbi:hypothetical protein BRCON_2123 [Candidatus Sumerlaea chitinivorans]|jgi:cell division protein FtsL|uniref:Cell division protein FtsL n=1 Tax=Sumerlaea chitinivorans TaxID=2250252 RepID=A0A2Z4Y6R3_SUMC1|nr:hypothetical protein BRCON_2123 [Candidatus Sumerlaea chitinivorans]